MPKLDGDDVVPARAQKGRIVRAAKIGLRYFANSVSLTLHQDGYIAASELAARLLIAEIRKLPRLATHALSRSRRRPAPHPRTQPDTIVRALAAKPVKVTRYRLDPHAFRTHVRSFAYPQAYAAGPLDEGGNRENKLLEYFVSLELLSIQPGDIVIDVASERSVFPAVVRTICRAKVFRQDLIYPPGVHGDRIGGSAASMPLPDEFANHLTLHNSFEHFEGSADSDFIAEAWRILKPGGVVCIVPLFVSEAYSIVTDPLTDRRGIVFDEGTRVVELPGWHNRFARFYDSAALEARVLAPAVGLGYELELVHFANVKDVHPRASTHFALLMRKPPRQSRRE
jgi:SAM-dependent methyltransferase